eukprot:6180965-Karenia_brevis.AAC.1
MKDKALPDGRKLMRFIVNLTPTNALLRRPEGVETETLPFVGDLVNMALDEDEVLYHFGEDLSVCFYLFGVNRLWSRRFCLNRRVWGPDVGVGEGWCYVALAVVPMGWTWAVEIIQHIHRGLAADAGLPMSSMLTSKSGLRKTDILFSLYIDNYDELQRHARVANVSGPSTWQQAMIDVYARHRLKRNPNKTEEAELQSTFYGAALDGEAGTIGVPIHKQAFLAFSLAFLLTQTYVNEKALRHVIGKFCHNAIFNR